MIKNLILVSVISLLFLFFFQNDVFAARAARCTDASPGGIPIITSLTPQDKKVVITWTPAPEPVTHYVLAYGTAKDNLIYGAPNIGGKDARSFTVDLLTNGTRYYFRIRAVNNCKPGDFSDTRSVTVGNNIKNDTDIPRMSFYKPVLGASTSAKKPGGAAVPSVQVFSLGQSCQACAGWKLLVVEGGTLLIFFFLSYYFRIVKPWLSLFIPILIYIYFSSIQGGCISHEFFCEYFLLLNLILFILVVLFYRQMFIHKVIRKNR